MGHNSLPSAMDCITVDVTRRYDLTQFIGMGTLFGWSPKRIWIRIFTQTRLVGHKAIRETGIRWLGLISWMLLGGLLFPPPKSLKWARTYSRLLPYWSNCRPQPLKNSKIRPKSMRMHFPSIKFAHPFSSLSRMARTCGDRSKWKYHSIGAKDLECPLPLPPRP